MYRLISKRELALYAAQISDLRKEVTRMQAQVDHERKRAEGAINLLLMRTVKAAITPDTGMSYGQEEQLREKLFDIFGEGADYSKEEAEELEKLQS